MGLEDNELTARFRLLAIISMVVLLATFVLAIAGIFGMVSYSTKLSRFEVGLKIVVGAKRITVVKQLLLDTLYPFISGCALALALFFMLMMQGPDVLSAYIVMNALTIGITIASLFLTTLVTSLLPAQKLLNYNPINALRNL